VANINELLKAKKAAKAKAESIINPVVESNGTLTENQNKDYDACVAEVKRLDDLIAKAQQVSGWTGVEQEAAAVRPNVGDNKDKFTVEQKEKAFDAFLRAKGNPNAMHPEMLAILNETTPADGGYTVPTLLNGKVIEKKVLANVFRSLPGVNSITTASTESFPVEANPAVCEWTAEQGNYQVASPTFGTVSIGAFKLTSYVKVSEELLQDSAVNIVDYVTRKIAIAVGKKEENAIIQGAGTTQPLGMLGIVGQGGNTTASATALTANELMDWFYALQPQYRKNSVIVASDSFELAVRKIKDSTSNAYLWAPAVLADTPNTLFARPLYTSSEFPTIGVTSPVSNIKSAVVFDPSYLTIADRGAASFVRDDSIGRLNGLVHFVYKSRMDALFTLAEAGKYLLMHT
jgi:HK97 family phage major capsid protein